MPPIELLAPAGSFMCAHYAFQAGADAVYLGLKEYSARSTAQNFHYEELLKLKQLALNKRKRIYIALNTVIREDELPSVLYTIEQLSRLEIDGLLVQDFGLAFLVRKYFPEFPLHASTQMAIHNRHGVQAARELGIKRIVLPRELPLESVKELKADFPTMEFEVFIHGALCYAYSGLCLASGLRTGGSGNRGRCAQLCRLCYTHEKREGYYLSCRDLFAGEKVALLVEAGVDSLKIEGRLKPPEYVYHVVRLYRYLLDHPANYSLTEYQEMLANSEFVFSREKTAGYLFGARDEEIITKNYYRSTGHLIGYAETKTDEAFSFHTQSSLEVNDVLQYFLNERETIPYKLPVRRLAVDGKTVPSVNAGTLVTVFGEKTPEPGQAIFKVYAKSLELEGAGHHTFPSYKRPVPLLIGLEGSDQATLQISAALGNQAYRFTHPVVFSPNHTVPDLAACLLQTLTNLRSPFYDFKIAAFDNRTPFAAKEITITGKLLRKILGRFLLWLAEQEELTAQNRIARYLQAESEAKADAGSNSRTRGSKAPDIRSIFDFVCQRSRLNPPRSRIPFYTGGPIQPGTIAMLDSICFIPLRPIVRDKNAAYYEIIERFIGEHPDFTIYIGINNVHQLTLLASWKRYSHLFPFIDFFFYLANRHTLSAVRAALPHTAFGYYWIEGDEKGHEALQLSSPFPLFKIDACFRSPLFVHEGDFERESLRFPAVDSYAQSENGERHYLLSHRNDRFTVITKDGYTYIC